MSEDKGWRIDADSLPFTRWVYLIDPRGHSYYMLAESAHEALAAITKQEQLQAELAALRAENVWLRRNM